MKLKGDIAVITGAASGIGAATARLFAAEGADLGLTDRDGDKLEAVAAECRRAGRTVKTLVADVADRPAAESFLASLTEGGRVPKVLVTAAGISNPGNILELDEAAWERIWRINVMGTAIWVKAALPAMIKARDGRIVTVASQLAYAGGKNNTAYIASKGAIVSFTKTVAVDFAKDGVRINTVAPAVIETPLSQVSLKLSKDPEALKAWRISRHPMGRTGQPEEVAKSILYLSCDDSSFSTGSTVFIDGGWTAA